MAIASDAELVKFLGTGKAASIELVRKGIESGEFGYGTREFSLRPFVEALEAFRTAMSFRFVEWLNHNFDVFVAYKAALGFIWA